MFGILFKEKNKNMRIANRLHSCAMSNSREKIFYTKYSVPDSFDGRFDLLVLHLFLIIHRIIEQDGGEELSQALFDVTFKNMKQTLREMGVGDVGVPKHMKKMMKAFNGRMHIYQSAVSSENLKENSDYKLKDAIARNVYGINYEDDLVDNRALNLVCLFVKNNLARNNKEDIKCLMSGDAHFLLEG